MLKRLIDTVEKSKFIVLNRDGDRSVVLAHVKEHYREAGQLGKRKIPPERNHSNENQSKSPLTNQPSELDNLENEECNKFSQYHYV